MCVWCFWGVFLLCVCVCGGVFCSGSSCSVLFVNARQAFESFRFIGLVNVIPRLGRGVRRGAAETKVSFCVCTQ